MEDNIIKGTAAQEMYKKVKHEGRLLYEVMVGSHSYGLNVETSDEDFKFVYIDSLKDILSGNATTQINVTDDYVGYEIGRYLELLRKQNPNIIEILYTDDKFIKFCDPEFRKYIINNRDSFLSNKIAFSFGEYAYSQIKKAQGTNKKFMNPIDKERKTLFDFCWVGNKQGSISLTDWKKQYIEDVFGFITNERKDYFIPEWMFGCVAIDHMKNCYHLFSDNQSILDLLETDNEELHNEIYAKRKYKGIIDKDGVQIKLSSTDKSDIPVSTFYCNIEGFSKYCKDYKEYWDWVEKRNMTRFVENSEAEINYDRKNMMHCHRLLNMATEMLSGEGVNVFRHDREELLNIRNGKSSYEELVHNAHIKLLKIKELHETTSLPENCDKSIMDQHLLDLRMAYYQFK